MRRLLGVLRADEEAGATRAPAPGLDRVDELVASARAAGLPVRLTISGTPRQLPSALDVDAYRPNGLVTPPPPRRRRWRRRPPKPIIKEASWIVPVSDDPEKRVAVIANQWRLVDASKLPIDEQRAWAVVAARAVTPADAQQLAERVASLQPAASACDTAASCIHRTNSTLLACPLASIADGPTSTR